MSSFAAPHPLIARLRDNRGLIFPFFFIALLVVILAPLPPAVLGFLLVDQTG